MLNLNTIGSLGSLGGGGRATASLPLFSGGTFTRSTEGSYLTGAPTDGSTAFLAWAAVDARRIENRGDGLGSMLLLEGARTNLVIQSRDVDTAGGWAAGSGDTPTLDAGTGPDGAALADREQVSSAGYGRYKATTGGGTTVEVSTSVYLKRMPSAGSGTAQVNPYDSAYRTVQFAIDETWNRASIVRIPSFATISYIPWEGRVGAAGVNMALDYLCDLHQIEQGAFPSSPIRTTTAAVTRSADALSYADTAYPASFLTRGFRVQFAPDASSAEVVTAGGMNVVYFAGGATSRLEFSFSGADCQLYSYDAGGAQLIATVTFSRGQLITIDWKETEVIISGCTTGDGTYPKTTGAMSGGTMHIGTSLTSHPFFGRFGQAIVAL